MDTIAENTQASHRLGDIELIPVSDGFVVSPLTKEFAPNTSIEEIRRALSKASMPEDVVTTTFTPLLIKGKAGTILIDTGFGPDDGALPGSTKGKTVANLALHGVQPADVDLVIISHFHADHVNGLISVGRTVYPNAEIAVPRIEWDFWMSDLEMGRAKPGRMLDLFRNNRRIFDPLADRVRLFDWNTDVCAGIHAWGTPGHSVGHTSFMVESDGKSVFVQSDITNQEALFVANPGWSAFFDQDPGLAVETRLKIYDMLSSEQILMQGFHHKYPHRNYVEKRPGGYALIPDL